MRATVLGWVFGLGWLVFSGCGHAQTGALAGNAAGEAPGEIVLERGGELADVRVLRASVDVEPRHVVVWGLSEVPDGSRLQMVLAGVDSLARSELLKVVEVRVRGLNVVREDSAGGRDVLVETLEATSGVLDQGGPLPHGWARVQRKDGIVLRVWARLEVPRAKLESALGRVAARAGRTPAAMVDSLGKEQCSCRKP
jgi:hypothetical protein